MKWFNAALLTLLFFASAYCLPSWAQTPSKQAPLSIKITRAETPPPSEAPAEHFTGRVRITSRFQGNALARVGGAQVSFAPGARTDWHRHPLGQTLVITAGTGLVQSWGGPVEKMHTGESVWIPPGVKHWHGATPNTSMTHLAIAESLNGKSVDWLEKVTNAQYGIKPSAPQETKETMNQEPTRAQQIMGDFTPKLAELTDTVLFGDIWERPELSPRDRSLITVAALISGGNIEQLASHLNRAKANGVTETEVAEVITHLAFYCGWPKAVSAVGVAKEVFKK